LDARLLPNNRTDVDDHVYSFRTDAAARVDTTSECLLQVVAAILTTTSTHFEVDALFKWASLR
jgi:hypothetical protein